MKLTIQSIHFTATDKLKHYIQKKSTKLDQFFDRIQEGTVKLKLEPEVSGANKLVEMQVSVPGDVLVARVQAKSFEAATDMVLDKMKTRLKRYKGRKRARA
ncbi:MAG: ribosome-associated translation inhibitor RaiA [Bacteroidota bacterium]